MSELNSSKGGLPAMVPLLRFVLDCMSRFQLLYLALIFRSLMLFVH